MMAHYVDQHWAPMVTDGGPRRARRAGPYRAYVPDLLTGRDLLIPPALSRHLSDATADLRDAVARVERADLGTLSDFFIRTEVTASSAIEGEHASPRKVALAEFTGYGRPNARAVVRNLSVVRAAMDDLVTAPSIELEALVDLQIRLIGARPDVPLGLRAEPVWIGGPSPLDARYVAPPAELVEDLMDDLLTYANTADVDPIVRAATVHAAFMTIHPFHDGNGRVGRALTNVLLARDQIGGRAVIPLSVALVRQRSAYFDALADWQTQIDQDRRAGWVAYFCDVLSAAAQLASDLADDVDQLRRSAHQAVLANRRRAVRADSVLLKVLDDLVHHPVSSAATVAARYGVSTVAARAALDELTRAVVLRPEKIDKGKEIAYTADSVLELVAGRWATPDTDLSTDQSAT